MAENSKIEWTDHTFNPWTGCTKVSPACDNCYAESWAKRSGLVQWGNHPRRRTSESYWQQPVKWDRIAKRDGIRRKVFCASLADVFDNQVDPEWRNDLWGIIYGTPHLDWLLLTKRPQNIAGMLPNFGCADWPFPNVWLGTTTENQQEADRRIPHLLRVPAKVRFLSCEPLLSEIDIRWALSQNPLDIAAGFLTRGSFSPGLETLRGIDWVIAGGESGPNARPSHPKWFRDLRDQCAAASAPFFFKQWGEFGPEGLPSQAWILRSSDGSSDPDPLPNGIGRNRKEGYSWAFRVGKKAAGAILDGVEHRGMP